MSCQTALQHYAQLQRQELGNICRFTPMSNSFFHPPARIHYMKDYDMAFCRYKGCLHCAASFCSIRLGWTRSEMLTAILEVQFGAFGGAGRDPRGWAVSVAYVALVPSTKLGVKAAVWLLFLQASNPCFAPHAIQHMRIPHLIHLTLQLILLWLHSMLSMMSYCWAYQVSG